MLAVAFYLESDLPLFLFSVPSLILPLFWCLCPQDECYQVRQAFAQKLHKGLCRLRLPLEYLAVFALCAKDPVKERRAHARQCLVKNINLRREYLKQHAAVSGEGKSTFSLPLAQVSVSQPWS